MSCPYNRFQRFSTYQQIKIIDSMITSLQNEKVKHIRSLFDHAKNRRKEGQIVLEGVRLVRDACQQGYRPDFVLSTTEADTSFLAMYGIEPLLVSNEVMRAASDTQQPQGIIGVFPMPQANLPPDAKCIVILDSIRDPGNL